MARRVLSVVPMSVGLLNEPPPQTPNSLADFSNPYTPRCAPDDSADSTPPDDVTTLASVASEVVCASAAGAAPMSMQMTSTPKDTSARADHARVFGKHVTASPSSLLLCAQRLSREIKISRKGDEDEGAKSRP